MSLYSNEDYNKLLNATADEVGYNAPFRLGSNGFETMTLDSWFKPMLSQPVLYNKFWLNLVNQFVYKATQANYFTSAFDLFRERGNAVGFGTYETITNPVFPLAYDMFAFDRVLKYYPPDVKAQYFAINVEDTYPQSINKKIARYAFTSYEALDSAMEQLIIAPRNGHTIIENNMIKELLNVNIASGAIKSRAYNKPTTEDGWRALAAEIQTIAMSMSAEPSTEFNNYANIDGADGPVWTQSRRDDLVFIGKAEVLANIRTYVLNNFNKDFVDFKFSFVTLADTGYNEYRRESQTWGTHHDGIYDFILCDGGLIKLEDNFEADLSDTNIFTVGIQRALNIEQTIGIRAFRNAIAFTSENVVLENITMTPDYSTTPFLINSTINQVETTIATVPAEYKASFNNTYSVNSAVYSDTTGVTFLNATAQNALMELITINYGDGTLSIEGDFNQTDKVKEILTTAGIETPNGNVTVEIKGTLTDVNSGKSVSYAGSAVFSVS